MMKLELALLLLLTTPLAARANDPRVGDVVPVMPSEKVERALNGTFDFPPSPPAPWTPDERGFAKERLFRTPAPGVYTRILFAPEDPPRICESLASNEHGTATMATLRTLLAKGLDADGTCEHRCFAALASGDLDAFRAVYQESPLNDNPPGSGFQSNIPGLNPATKWGTRNALLASLGGQGASRAPRR